MKAVGIEQYGSKDCLMDIMLPKPVAQGHQVVVQVKATSVNPIDWKIREGHGKEALNWVFPIILGWDVAGVITEIGADVTDWHVGDKIFARPATTRIGTYAEYTIVDENLLAPMPENLTFEEAASVPLAGSTAWEALIEYGLLKKGQRVLVHGGSGGVGTFAIQIAKFFGAYVIATASEKNHVLLQSIGTDQVIDYHTTDFSEVLQDIDLVFDTIGGETQEKSFQVLKKGTGRLVSIVSEPSHELMEKYQVYGKSFLLSPDGERLKKLGQLIEENIVRPVIGATFPFSRAGVYEAHALSETHHAVGKIVISMA